MSQSSTASSGLSSKIKAQAARLVAVQAIYEYTQNQRSVGPLIEEYLHKRIDAEIDGHKMVTPDGDLLRKIVAGVAGRLSEVEDILKANLVKDGEREKTLEPLLKAIMLAGIYEILAHQDIDFPIIINDYLQVAHSFYPPGEAKLVNAVLDAVAKILRC